MRSLSFGAAQDLPSRHRRTRLALTLALAAVLAPAAGAQDPAPRAKAAQTPEGGPALFRSSVNLVSIAAVVRDRRGRVLPSLARQDFQILDEGQTRAVVDVRADSSAPASVALLVDGSGSMRLSGARTLSQRISEDLLAGLNPSRDAAALLSFDTRLLTLCEFTRDFDQIRTGLNRLEAFGQTSIYDAVAGSAALVAERARNRRAVIVLTDGLDNASTYSPQQVAWIASTIDVPIYVFDVGEQPVGRSPRKPAARGAAYRPSPREALTTLARATGGDLFVANTPLLVALAVRRVAEELRSQYLIAFEGAVAPGMRRIEVRMRKPDLKVQARGWYQVADE